VVNSSEDNLAQKKTFVKFLSNNASSPGTNQEELIIKVTINKSNALEVIQETDF
jgi:hypothetical protein